MNPDFSICLHQSHALHCTEVSWKQLKSQHRKKNQTKTKNKPLSLLIQLTLLPVNQRKESHLRHQKLQQSHC